MGGGGIIGGKVEGQVAAALHPPGDLGLRALPPAICRASSPQSA